MIADDYANDVISGRIVTNQYIKLACERYFRFKEKYDFREDKVDKVVNFIQRIRHFQGRHNGKPFILEPWQYWIVANIFGFYKKGTKERVITDAYVEVARKNGKTALMSAIALYCMMADGESGAEVDCIANSRKQAHILFDLSTGFADSLDPRGKYIKQLRDTIKFDITRSHIQVLSSDAAGNDGYNASVFIEDELHAAPDSKLYDVMKSSQGMRDNPLAICITSAGFNLFSFCYTYRKSCIEILHDIKEDDSQFVAIYAIDEGDNWTDPDVWIKANPNLGVTVKHQYLQKQVTKAKINPSTEVSTRTKNCGEWIAVSDIWLSNDLLLQSSAHVDIHQFVDQDILAYVGIDLAAVSDLTAVAIMIPYNGKLYFKVYYYIPYSALFDNSNAELYKDWKRRGLLTVTDGNVTDYDYILNDILKCNSEITISKVAYDSWNSTQFAIDATSEGLPMEPFGQSLGNFNRPTKELERLIKSGRVVIDDNEITRFCFSNVVLKHDYCDNVKPTKLTNQNKIDGVIAIIESLGTYLLEPQYNNEFIPMGK